MFLEKKGITDTSNLRFCREDKKEFVYLNKQDGKTYTIEK